MSRRPQSNSVAGDAAPDEREALGALRILLSYVARAATPNKTEYYTSGKRGPHPPGKTGRWLREHAHEIPGARRVGRDWVVTIEEFDAWTGSRQQKASARRAQPVAPTSSTAWSPKQALVDAGVREMRGVKK